MKKWIIALRAPFFTASLAPVAVGVAAAFYEGARVNWWTAALTLLGVVALHAGTNVANDYFDHRSRNDWVNPTPVTPFAGGSRVIQQGLITPRGMFLYALGCYAVGAAIGLYLWWVTPGNVVLWLGVIGAASGFFYTAAPVALGYRGVGEIFVGLNFGPLAALGADYVQTGHLSLAAFLAGIPVGLLIAGVLYINEFPDYQADKQVNKRTLVVLLGPRRARYGYYAILFFTYLSVAASVVLAGLPAWTFLAFATLPLATKALAVARRHYAEPFKLVPANALTILIHIATSLLVAAGMVLGKVA